MCLQTSCRSPRTLQRPTSCCPRLPEDAVIKVFRLLAALVRCPRVRFAEQLVSAAFVPLRLVLFRDCPKVRLSLRVAHGGTASKGAVWSRSFNRVLKYGLAMAGYARVAKRRRWPPSCYERLRLVGGQIRPRGRHVETTLAGHEVGQRQREARLTASQSRVGIESPKSQCTGKGDSSPRKGGLCT